MSKQSSLLCVVCVLVLLLGAVLASGQQLLAQIGDEFLCQDPIRGPGSLMLNHVRDKLNSDRAAPALTQEEHVVIDDENAFFSGDEYAREEDQVLFVGDGHAMDPDRSADGEEFVVKEEDEEDSLLGGHGADSGELGSGGDIQCPECGKHFRSDKSMFGHLRSHPDRGYKGATPPPAKPKLLPTPVEDGRPVARYSQRDPKLNTFEILAAYIMLTLKRRDSPVAQDQSVNVKREPDVPEAEDSVVSKARDDVELGDKHGNTVQPSEDVNSVTTMARDDKARCSEHVSSVAEMAVDNPVHHHSEHVSSIAVDAPTKRGRAKKSKEAHRKKKDVASASKATRPYICKHCQAVFPTHQALGGHMAAHNKDRKVQAQNEQAAAWEAHHQGQRSLNRQEPKGGGGEEGEQRGGGLSASARALLMERYTRLFNTGWQSRQESGGGYKRQHTGSEAGGSLPPVAPPVTDGDQRRLFGVDLNVQAPGQE